MKFNKILLTTDFSEASLAALDYISKDNRHEGAEILLLHVNPILDSIILSSGEFSSPLILETHMKESTEFAIKKLNELAEKYLANAKVKTFVLNAQNSVTDCIIECAVDNNVDLILTSTQGHGALGSLLLGSTSQKLLLLSPKPVLVIPYRK